MPMENKPIIGGDIDVWAEKLNTLLDGVDARDDAQDAAIALKVDATALARVATTGSYDDLTDVPTIPDSADDLGAVPTSRTVNGKALVTNISLTASDVSAVPTSTTVNGHALTGDISVTKSDLGLGNLDNTSDLNKPISTATQVALNLKANASSLSAVATSGAYGDLSGKPTIPVTAADVGAVPTTRTINTKALSSDVTLTKGDVGLGSVDNTADTAKPISDAEKTAISAAIRWRIPATSSTVWPTRSSVVPAWFTGLAEWDGTAFIDMPDPSTAQMVTGDIVTDRRSG